MSLSYCLLLQELQACSVNRFFTPEPTFMHWARMSVIFKRSS